MATIALFSKDTGLVIVDRAQYDGPAEDATGWSKKETEAAGFKPATAAQIAAANRPAKDA